MSWGTCYSGTNNIHFNLPSLMSDGRNYTSWTPQVAIDNQIVKENNIQTNMQYRHFLQNNALNIIKNNQLNSCDECGICPFHPSTYKNLTQPFFYANLVNNDSPFGYNNSDLKNQYLSRQTLQSRLFTPISIN